MATVPNAKKITYEEWLRMPEVRDGKEEVVNGEIRIMPPPKMKHSWIVYNLQHQIEPQVDNRVVAVLVVQFGLVISRAPLTSRVPDLSVFIRSTIVEQDGYIHSAPQLVVEVRSPSNTLAAIQEKVVEYASIGVPEMWVFTPDTKTVQVFHLEDGRLRCVQTLKEAGVLTPKLFPEVRVDIARIWPE